MIKAFRICLILFLLCFNLTLLSFGQEKLFAAYLVETNLTYKEPKDYKELNVKGEYVPVHRASSPSFIFHLIKNESKDIVIGFVLIPISKVKFKTDSVFFRNYEPNDNLVNTARSEADTSRSPIYYYNAKELDEINAKEAVRYNLKMNGDLFLNKYDSCKAVIIHRDNIGDGFMYYFYNSNSKNQIDEEIKKTSVMLKFRSDSLYKPVIFKQD